MIRKDGTFDGSAIVYGIIYEHEIIYVGLKIKNRRETNKGAINWCLHEAKILKNDKLINVIDENRKKINYVVFIELKDEDVKVQAIERDYYDYASLGLYNMQSVDKGEYYYWTINDKDEIIKVGRKVNLNNWYREKKK